MSMRHRSTRRSRNVPTCRSGPTRRGSTVRKCVFGCGAAIAVVLCAGTGPAPTPVFGQEADDAAAPTARERIGQSFEEQSIALRTALHNDPSLASPLERLVSLYREAGRRKELLELYRGHLRQYPNDANAQTVLIRLMMATGDPAALTSAQNAVARFPDNAFLRYLLFKLLKQQNDGQAIEELDKAIELETRPARRLAWLEELLPEADLRDRRDLARKHLKALAELPRNAEDRLALARLMNRYRFHELALKTLTEAAATSGTPEVMVDIELEAASAEAGLDRTEDAAARLKKLLGRLTGDYWRRPDIVRRRLALITSPDKRDEIIAAARERVEEAPRSEAAALDLAQTLAAMQFRREALDALLAAEERMPQSEAIEQRTLDLFDRLRDERGREEYLRSRIERFPNRSDLVLKRVKSLYLLGRRKAADELFEGLIEPMSRPEQADQVLEMARFLRRSNLTIEAANWFARCLELDPDRLDVRRELAETRLALGQRQKVRKAFANVDPAEAPVEEVLDLVQFMLQEKLLVEASGLIRERLEIDDQNLDLLLLLINVERRLGRLQRGTELIEETRKLADTGARYRAWLEAAVPFFDEFESTEEFLLNERTRLQNERGEWTETQLERRLAFADVAAANDLIDPAAALLRSDLDGDLTADMRLAVRRQLIDILKDEAAHLATVEEELNRLAEEDPQSVSAYSAQLALLHKRMNREDRAVQYLQKVDPKQIRDAALLSSLLNAFRNRLDYGQLMTDVLERLTQINPGDRGVWEQWLTVLAAKREEEALRVELRRLLAGVEELTIGEETRELLQLYLVDSYWRSISRELTGGGTGAFAEILPLLDAIERMARNDQQWLWMTWIRACALNRLGNTEARDQAISELNRMVSTLSRPVDEAEDSSHGDPAVGDRARDDSAGGDSADEHSADEDAADEDSNDPNPNDAGSNDGRLAANEPRIVFPDGVSISMQQARVLLSESKDPKKSRVPVPDGQTLLPPFDAQWKWSAGHPVTAIHPVSAQRVLIGDSSGRVSCVDVPTGKLAWQRDDVLATGTGSSNQNSNRFNVNNPGATASQPGYRIVLLSPSAEDEPDRFCTSGLSSVSCFSLKDGGLLWRADVGAMARKPGSEQASLQATQPGVSIFPRNERGELLTWDPLQSTLTRIDTVSGKVLWYRTLSDSGGSRQADNCGASLYGDRLFVYGPKTAILDTKTGDTVWSFEAQKLRSFPVSLEEKSDASPSVAAFGSASPYGGITSQKQRQMSAYLQANPAMLQQVQMQIRSGMMTSSQAQAMVVRSMTGGSSVNANPWQFNRSNPLLLSSAAVSWAGNARRGVASHARLLDSKLVLFQSGQVQSVDLDVPLAAQTATAQGLVVGLSGRVACMLGTNSTLNFVDLTTGSTRTYQPTDILPKSGRIPAVRIQATLDGMLCYLTGQRGIQCVNVKSGEPVYSVGWPSSVVPASSTVTQSGSTTRRVVVRGSHVSHTHSSSSTNARNPRMTSTVATIHNGILYTLSAADTVVALKGASLDGR